jgi:hypothetical protein
MNAEDSKNSRAIVLDLFKKLIQSANQELVKEKMKKYDIEDLENQIPPDQNATVMLLGSKEILKKLNEYEKTVRKTLTKVPKNPFKAKLRKHVDSV